MGLFMSVEEAEAALVECQVERTADGKPRRWVEGTFADRVHRMSAALVSGGNNARDESPRLVALTAIHLVETVDAELRIALDRYGKKRT